MLSNSNDFDPYMYVGLTSVKGSDVCVLNLACVNGHIDFARFLIAEKLYDVNGECVEEYGVLLGDVNKWYTNYMIQFTIIRRV